MQGSVDVGRHLPGQIQLLQLQATHQLAVDYQTLVTPVLTVLQLIVTQALPVICFCYLVCRTLTKGLIKSKSFVVVCYTMSINVNTG